jgi:hypothetical protein
MRQLIILLVFCIGTRVNAQSNCYRQLILVAKKTTVLCGSDKTEPPFDITVYLDSLSCKLEIYGYGQSSKYNFKIDSVIKCVTNGFADTILYGATLDDEEENENFHTEILYTYSNKKYFLNISIPQFDNCKIYLELKLKKGKNKK